MLTLDANAGRKRWTLTLDANAGGKQPIHHQPHLVQYKHQANLLLLMNNYNPLVISKNNKNKPMKTGINRNK